MGKMFNTLVLSGLASIALFLLDGSGVLGVIAKLFLGPQTDWGSFLTGALTTALGGMSILGGAAIIIGAVVIKQDWLVRAGMFTVLVSWIEAPLIQLWQFMGGKILSTAACTNAMTCPNLVIGASSSGMIIAGLIMGPIVLYGVWAAWSYIWSPESSG